ncbi:DUF805 domain-containing protein [uncultured Algimonas sp.]|uniref:DUF805 domain-containing protein n=1 Tax=uncultured Algimonas sp. TaxID=1547920 RepID=UPI00260B727A|nr:DUF805 domain-containing protein [uncultured Algimonas sp.]
MGNLLFSPSGRIGPSAYFKGVMILGVISALASLLGLTGAFAMTFVILGILLVLLVSFVMLGIKRSHDAGKTGWMVLTHILLYLGVSTALDFILKAVGLGPDPELQARVMEAQQSQDVTASMELTGEALQAAAIPGAISSIIGAVIVAYLINMFNKQDLGDNQYGPVPPA